MKLLVSILGLFAIFFSLLATMAEAAPFSTITACTTTTITVPNPTSFTTTTIIPTSTSLTLTTTTTTMPSSTTTSYTTVTAPVPTGTTVPEYGQCGGLGYNGPTTCDGPFVCVCTSAWWCSCQPATEAELDLENNTPSTDRVVDISPSFHPNFITSTYSPTAVTKRQDLQLSKVIFSDSC